MYRVRFYVDGKEMLPFMDYNDEKVALRAKQEWEEVFNNQVHTAIIEKI